MTSECGKGLETEETRGREAVQRAEDEQLLDLFHMVITRDPRAHVMVKNAIKTNPSLLNTAIKFCCPGNDYECSCWIDHEMLQYISPARKNDLAYVLENVKQGKCSHCIAASSKDRLPPFPTSSVYLVHAASAVGYISLLKDLLQTNSGKALLTSTFRLSPLHIAILHEQSISVDAIMDFFRSDQCTQKTKKSYCKKFFQCHMSKPKSSYVFWEKTSIFKLCIMKNDIKTAKEIVENKIVEVHWFTDALKAGSDPFIDILFPCFKTNFIESVSWNKARNFAVQKGQNRLITKEIQLLKRKRSLSAQRYRPYALREIALLMIIYNQPSILKEALTPNLHESDVLGYTPLDISNSLGHTDCSDILRLYNIKTCNQHNTSPYKVVLKLTKMFELKSTTEILIRKVRRQQSDSSDTEIPATIVFESMNHECNSRHGAGLRTLLDMCKNIEKARLYNLAPLSYVIEGRDNVSPCCILDILYFNPLLTNLKTNRHRTFLEDSHTFTTLHTSLVKCEQKSILEQAVERDLENSCERYEARLWAEEGMFEYSNYTLYEGSMSSLLLDCGYDIRADKSFLSKYTRFLSATEIRSQSADRREMMRIRILEKIERELFHTKSLQERSREVLRRNFVGHRLQHYVNSVEVPTIIRDFILMESRLKKLCFNENRRASICSIDGE